MSRGKRGTIYKRVRNGHVQWVGQYDATPGPDGKRKRKTVTGKTRAEVTEKLKALTGQADSGRLPEPGRTTVEELGKVYFEHLARDNEPTTVSKQHHTWDKHVAPRIGAVQLRHLGVLDVARFVAALDRDFEALAQAEQAAGKPGVQRRDLKHRAFTLLKQALAYAVDLDLLADNPADRVKGPQRPRREVEALTAEQATRLLEKARTEAQPWVRAAVSLGLCGLRMGEVFGLRWGDVDLEAGEVQVRQALKQPAKGKPYLGSVKTKASRRTVPLPPWAVEALAAHRALLGATPLPGVLVFQNERGGPIHTSNFTSRPWRALRDAAELPEGFTFHGTRHTAATLLLGAGVDVRTVSGLLGHARPSITLDVYAAYIPSNAIGAMETLGVLLGGSA